MTAQTLYCVKSRRREWSSLRYGEWKLPMRCNLRCDVNEWGPRFATLRSRTCVRSPSISPAELIKVSRVSIELQAAVAGLITLLFD